MKQTDKITYERLDTLHPKIVCDATLAIEEINEKVLDKKKAYARISQAHRSTSDQAKLYAQGRTAPGKRVTDAPPGSSYHEYGLAVDFVLIVNGKEASWDIAKDYNGDGKADWMQVVEVFKKYGFAWGGDWKTLKDYPHFEKTFGYSIAQLKDKVAKKDFIPGTNFVNI